MGFMSFMMMLLINQLIGGFMSEMRQNWWKYVFTGAQVIFVSLLGCLSKVIKTLYLHRQVILFTYLLLITNYLCFERVKGEEIALPIPAICDQKAPSEYLTFENCLQSCNIRGLTNKVINLTIFNQDAEDIIKVAECQRFKTRVTFTETWTFSKMTFKAPDELLLPDVDKCKEIVRNSCGNNTCETSAPIIEPNFVFAADNTKEIDWTKIKVQQKVLPMSFLGKSYIRLEGKLVDYKAGYWNSEIKDKLMYIWHTDEDLKCKLKPAYAIQCNILIDNRKEVYLCANSKLIVTPDHTLETHYCNSESGMSMSKEGIIFSKTARLPLSEDKLPIYTESIDQALKTVVLQSRVQDIIREDHLCRSNCHTYHMGTLNNEMSLYGNIWMLRQNRTTLRCREDPTCELKHPIRYCGERKMIEIHCNERVYWWNPTKSYVTPFESCMGHQTDKEELQVLSGGGLYIFNSSGSFHVGGMELEPQKYVPSLKDNIMWIGKEKVSPILSQKIKLLDPISEKLPDKISRGLSFNLGISDFLSSIEHTTKVYITLGTVLILMVCILPMFNCCKRNSYEPVEYGVQYIR